MSSAYNSFQMFLDSQSILPRSEPRIEPEGNANMVSENVQEFAHPNDVAAMQAEWAQACAEHEYLQANQWSSAALQVVRDNQASFPTLNQFTAPVAGLPQFPPMDQNQYHFQQPTFVPQLSLEGHAWSQPGYNNERWVAEDPRTYGNAHAGAIMDTMSDTETFLPSASASDSDATMYLTDDSILEPSSSAPIGQTCARRPKRKTRHTVTYEEDGSSSSPAPTTRKRRCLDDDEDEVREGKFGFYRLADATAVVMAMPVHDPKPVDISTRRTHDAQGNLLRTRRFGAMELDDSYSKRSVKITNELPTGMTCVRACEWTDQPCGLFVEMNKVLVADHLLHWHGVESKGTTLCKFEGCSKPKAMLNLGRHIEGIHYTTSYECPYCGKRWSRSDSLDRHQVTCRPLLDSRARAKKGRREFSLQDRKKLVYGYIVPARNAT
ncbi:hypothetical protein BDR06DRAFT_600497 [Suillus hirtellus]|nr:hypothetical protein BDR06DRAFT_600497 [Suillus hirtellus]